ncbi:hypothetical protein CEXT_82701 [Caerostris extrusa]|uniref:Uncharacterized protein n=1 Tax=Caerostris extrusa TaxID=172846 RepID=A0AAV4MA96_CAEEX|nr:hypothetical protein CEXT_82701 [Caerostris extrusa]
METVLEAASEGIELQVPCLLQVPSISILLEGDGNSDTKFILNYIVPGTIVDPLKWRQDLRQTAAGTGSRNFNDKLRQSVREGISESETLASEILMWTLRHAVVCSLGCQGVGDGGRRGEIWLLGATVVSHFDINDCP